MNPAPAQSKGVRLQVRGLQKRFAGIEVLRGVELDIQPGEIFVIMGPSGSGKSVLLRHLIGLETPDAGEIQVNGEGLSNRDVMSRYRMAMVFQSGALLNSLTVGENVGLYLREHRLKPRGEIARIVSETLELVGLKGIENRSPSELSGGMKKRVAIARALVIEPQVILYDEPTSELDPLSSVLIAEEIVRMRDRIGATSVVVTHDRELAFEVADRIAMIFDGQFHTVASPDELRRSTDSVVQDFLNAGSKPIHH
jgi:phospholipid/cholesterol/gamma-HCH transport system ATP-binding protein